MKNKNTFIHSRRRIYKYLYKRKPQKSSGIAQWLSFSNTHNYYMYRDDIIMFVVNIYGLIRHDGTILQQKRV